MKLALLALAATLSLPLAAHADSSQPNSASGLEGQPVTPRGEGTSGMSQRAYPGTRMRGTTGSGTTDAGKTGWSRSPGASDSSVPGATNPNEPIGTRR